MEYRIQGPSFDSDPILSHSRSEQGEWLQPNAVTKDDTFLKYVFVCLFPHVHNGRVQIEIGAPHQNGRIQPEIAPLQIPLDL